MGAEAGAGRLVGYCTNVHAGATLDETRANLQRYALAVRDRVAPGEPLGVGLWLSAAAARELLASGDVAAFAAWLRDAGLDVFTFNGFPWGDFHQPVVKHAVYAPDWRSPRRVEYTLDLAAVLEALLERGGEGSISTLPLGWGETLRSGDDLRAAAANLRRVAVHLARREHETGRLIHLDIEPEPGCRLDTSAGVAAFFAEHLLDGGADDALRRHVRVCHDVCHAAVMFEDQAAAFARYDAAGIEVGKVQVSSAVRARFDAAAAGDRRALLEALRAFDEPRYLHQTVTGDGRFFEDLPAALAAHDEPPSAEWRVHFHVPVFLERLGLLETTRDELVRCVELLRRRPAVRHFEIETYAWDVLPPPLKGATLADDIAREMTWFSSVLAAEQPA